MTAVASVPLVYRGVKYRSHLEADWAATFDRYGIYFQYEPELLRMPSGAVYDPDFFLPNQRVYAEAKGEHNERLWKPRELAAVLTATTFPREYLVVVLRAAGPHGRAFWEAADDRGAPMLARCDGCIGWAFTDIDEAGDYYCRQCGGTTVLRHAYFPGDLEMARAPRPNRGA